MRRTCRKPARCWRAWTGSGGGGRRRPVKAGSHCYEHAGRLGRAAEAPVEAWVKTKGHLLPFCSHTIPKHPQRTRTNDNQEGIENCSSFRTRRHGLKATHNPKVAGSNPAPATMNDEGLADVAAANPFRFPRLHPGNGRPPRRRGAAAGPGRQWALSLPYHLRYLQVWDDGTPISRMPTGAEPRHGLRDGLLVVTVRVLSSRRCAVHALSRRRTRYSGLRSRSLRFQINNQATNTNS
jgi:hypothetical protein